MSPKHFESTIVAKPGEALGFVESILESSTECSIIVVDMDGKILAWNEGARKLYGYEPHEVIGKASFDMLHLPEDGQAGRLREILATAMLVGKWEGKSASVRKNGERFNVHGVYTPRKDSSGKPIGWILISSDLTPREEAMKALERRHGVIEETTMRRKSREFYQSLLDSFPALVWRCGVDGKCDYFNRTWLDFTGRTLEQEMGDGWANGVHPEDLTACLRDFLNSFHARQPLLLEYRLRRHDGEYRWIVDQGQAFYDLDGTFAGYIGSCFDVSERKGAEEALRKSEQRFAAIMENMPGFAWIKDADGRVVYLNQSSAQIARSPSDWHGKTDHELWPPETAAQYTASDQTVLASGQPLHTVEPYPDLDGGVGFMLVSKFPIFDANGAVMQVGGLGIDVTERKRAEELLENSREQLRALTAKLHTVREEESSHLSREIHDELGHALTGLNMDLNWMRRKLDEEWNPALRSQLQKRMNSMTASLETTARAVQRIAAELRPGMLDDLGLAAALEWNAEEFETRTGISCQWEFKPEDTPLNRDRATALYRVFQEILSNVARHAAAQSLKLKLAQSGGQLVLEVFDNGRGFDEKKVADHKSLGLLGMRERAAFVGGQVTIDTHPGKGTKVRVTCPAG